MLGGWEGWELSSLCWTLFIPARDPCLAQGCVRDDAATINMRTQPRGEATRRLRGSGPTLRTGTFYTFWGETYQKTYGTDTSSVHENNRSDERKDPACKWHFMECLHRNPVRTAVRLTVDTSLMYHLHAACWPGGLTSCVSGFQTGVQWQPKGQTD